MISILVALNSEAKAFIDFFSLKQLKSSPFAYYSSADADIEVLVCGIGALSMASAVGWVSGVNPVDRVWLNVGIAGHANKPVGELVLVHGCADAVDVHAHYPPLLAPWPESTAACLSYNAPCTDYPGDALVDMEAHSFFTAARKFSNSEFVQSIKVVSDNASTNISDLNPQSVHALILPHASAIVAYAQALHELRAATMIKVEHDVDISALRATHSQSQQAQELLQKASILKVLNADLVTELEQSDNIKRVLQILTKKTRLQSPVLSNG